MEAFRRFYRQVWLVDFEFHQPDGERPLPLCMAAQELFSHRLVNLWLEGRPPPHHPGPWVPTRYLWRSMRPPRSVASWPSIGLCPRGWWMCMPSSAA